MKKLSLILLSMLLIFTLAACGNKCEHTYDNACDAACNECNETRLVQHDYTVLQNDETHHWYACSVCERPDGENKAKHAYDNDCDTSCNTCGNTRPAEHAPNADDGDCTTAITCSVCGDVATEARSEHTGGAATCTHGKLCEVCGYEYDITKAPENHVFVDGVCACGESRTIDATEMTAEQLNAAVAEKLAAGETDITVILAPDADTDKWSEDTSTMQYAIRSALSDSAVADGSIDLTIKGLNVVFEGFLGTWEYWDEEAQVYVEKSAVTKIRSITFTDATKIGYGSFEDCTSLVSVFAPNVSYIGSDAFAGCTSLETLRLTAEKEIDISNVFDDTSDSKQVKLILHVNKQANVVKNALAGYTFEAVTYVCANGTIMHSVGEVVAYFWNEDYTVCSAGYACTKCGYVDVVETVSATLEAESAENHTAHSAVFTNAVFETQTKALGYIYDSETNTYSVWNEDGLNIWRLAVAEDKAANLTLMADITLSTEGITVDENGKPSASNWTAIKVFEGTFDGNGYSIINLRIYDEIDADFISSARGATIQNLTLVNPVVYGESSYTAGLVSIAQGGTSIINCHVQGGSITGENGVGGLLGTISYNVNYIYGCTNSAKVTGDDWVGGIVGLGGSDSISNMYIVIVACANFGEVSGNQKLGGIIGKAYSSEMLIGCYTTEGNLCGDTNPTVTGCYYVASEDADRLDGTTAVTDVNTTDVVNTMNAAIDNYNRSAKIKVSRKWTVDAGGVPVLVEAE